MAIRTLEGHETRPCMRQCMRILPEGVQRDINNGHFQSDTMRTFVHNNFALLLGKFSTEGVLYIGVHGRPKAWYIGRTANTRTRSAKTWHGPALRWREHFCDTFSRKTGQPARRNKIWNKFAPCFLYFLAVEVGSTTEIGRKETVAIRSLQPPTQSTPTGKGQNLKQKRTRPWPSARCRPSVERECDLNLRETTKTS